MLLPILLCLALQETPERVVLGYAPSWSSAEVRLEGLTHLAHAFLQTDEDGTLKDDKQIPHPDLVRRAKAAGVRALLSLGGAASAPVFRAIVSKPAALKRYADAVAGAAVTNGYAGVDVDWEPTENDDDKAGMVLLVKALREAFAAKSLTPVITMAAPAGSWGGRWWDVEALLPLVDLLNVMAYDFHGPWSSHAGHNAPLKAAPDDPDCGPAACVEGAMSYWRKTRAWPAAKLVVGIPCYARGFAVPRWGLKPATKLKPETLDLKGIGALLSEGWVRGFDPKVGVPLLLGEAGLYSFEDAESAALKGAWAREQGFRGIFFWHLAQDHGEPGIVRAAARAFRKP